MSQIGKNTGSLVPNQSPEGDKVISFMLKAIEARLAELKGSVDVSKTMLPLGVDTDLTSTLKKAIQDPITHILDRKSNVDSSIASLLILFTKTFFESHKDKIAFAYQTDLGINHELHFSIVLNDDNFGNRSEILGFLREYKNTEGWDTFPLKFQFIPKEVAERIAIKEQLI